MASLGRCQARSMFQIHCARPMASPVPITEKLPAYCHSAYRATTSPASPANGAAAVSRGARSSRANPATQKRPAARIAASCHDNYQTGIDLVFFLRLRRPRPARVITRARRDRCAWRNAEGQDSIPVAGNRAVSDDRRFSTGGAGPARALAGQPWRGEGEGGCEAGERHGGQRIPVVVFGEGDGRHDDGRSGGPDDQGWPAAAALTPAPRDPGEAPAKHNGEGDAGEVHGLLVAEHHKGPGLHAVAFGRGSTVPQQNCSARSVSTKVSKTSLATTPA